MAGVGVEGDSINLAALTGLEEITQPGDGVVFCKVHGRGHLGLAVVSWVVCGFVSSSAVI